MIIIIMITIIMIMILIIIHSNNYNLYRHQLDNNLMKYHMHDMEEARMPVYSAIMHSMSYMAPVTYKNIYIILHIIKYEMNKCKQIK